METIGHGLNGHSTGVDRPWQPVRMHNTDKTSAVVFPGQGSQFPGMADPWTQTSAGNDVLDEASEAIGRDIVAGCRDEASLATTEFVQPALLACAVAAFRVLEAGGIAFAGAAGHSLGEFAALVAADVIGLADALDVVVVRGRAMQRAGEERPGTMSALLGVDAEAASALCDEARDNDVLAVANENSPVQVVISGSIPATSGQARYHTATWRSCSMIACVFICRIITLMGSTGSGSSFL